MYGELGLFIDGAWRKNGGGNKGEDVLNPATEKPLAHLPHASIADLDQAWNPPSRASLSGGRPRPTTAARSCTRLPT